MSRNLNLPFFPIPPDEYDQRYFAEILRSFSTYMQNMQNPGEGRHTQLTLTNLPDSDQGLEVGSLFHYRDVSGSMGDIRITTADKSNLRGNSATTAVGIVTVTT